MIRLIVCYDISDDERRNNVAKVLGEFGDRIQYSVFSCDVANEYPIRTRLKAVIDPSVDSILIVNLGCGYARRTFWLGQRRIVTTERDLIF